MDNVRQDVMIVARSAMRSIARPAGAAGVAATPCRLARLVAVIGVVASAPLAAQQAPSGADSRAAVIAAAQAEKAKVAAPYKPPLVESVVLEIGEHLTRRHVRLHPYYEHAYPGAGLTAGLGYVFHPADYDTLDVRAALSLNQSKMAGIEYQRPRLFARRAAFTTQVGWREGLGQAFYGIGATATSRDDRTRFDFRQVQIGAHLDFRPRRNHLVFGGGVEALRYEQRPAAGSSFTTRYSAASLPGVGATVDYLHGNARLAFDWRPTPGYADRGGAYGVTARRFHDLDGPYSFSQIDYDLVQHVPVLREAWVLSVHARAETTHTAAGDEVPFFMLPTLGNATTLRAFANQRFRDRNSLLLSAEWRILLNEFLETGLFYDAGKVTARPGQLSLAGLKSGYGVGFRLHTAAATPVRIELAHGNEGLRVVFAARAAF